MSRIQLNDSRQRTLPVVLFSLVTLAGSLAGATEIVFTIDPAQSKAVWSGWSPLYGIDFEEQFPGSLEAPLSGHFLVEFDATTATPSTLKFVGGHGYYEVSSPHDLAPGINGAPGTAPGNLGGQAFGGAVSFAVRDLVWDFFSDPIERTVEDIYPGNLTKFQIISGGMDSNTGDGHDSFSGSNFMTAGEWSLTETSSGHWELSTPEIYYEYGGDDAMFRAGGYVVSTAQFSATANVAQVAPEETTAEALGGVAAVGGIAAEFSAPTGGGTLTVQQVPDNTGLSQDAIAAAEINPIFALSTEVLDVDPQIWNVDFSGTLSEGTTVTLTFHYDSSEFPLDFDELTLGIWHFDSNANNWEFGGVVDPATDTIAYTTDNFSPFMLGVLVVPEPSSLLLVAVGTIGPAAVRWRRHRRRSVR